MANPTQENAEAITAMTDANASSMDADDQRELVEQATIQVALNPATIRSAEQEELRAHPIPDLIALQEFIAAQSVVSDPLACFRPKRAILPGCG